MNAIATAVTTYLASQGSNNNSLPTQLANAQKTGWIFAGGYYYTITQVNNNNLKDARPTLTTAMTDPQSGTTDNPNALQNYRNNFAAAGALIDAVNGNTSSSDNASVNVVSAGAISDAMIQTTTPSGTNPLVQLAAAGFALLMAAQITFAVFLAVSLALGIVSGLNAFVLGTGAFNPMAVSTPTTYMILVPLMASLLGIMVSMGALLGVYVPLIPYVIFTFGAIGWLISTIETMVAGPLVALGILAPGGHHEILGKAEPALLLLFNVFLRPSLMIFGLVAAMLLANVVLTMINAMFGQVLLQIMGTGTGTLNMGSGAMSAALAATNPLEMVFFLIAYVLLIIASLNKCFAAIHIIPERVMRWMSGQGEQYGEGEGLGEMKHGVASGAERGVAMGREMGKTTETVGDVKGKAQGGKNFANQASTTAAPPEGNNNQNNP
jgi:defect-in-organelle-trafficking protein DotA